MIVHAAERSGKAEAPFGSEVVPRLIWMAMWLQHRNELRLSDAREKWGVSLRTFRRDLARLRHAGLILDTSAETQLEDPAVVHVGWRSA